MPLNLTDFRPLDVRESSPFGGVLADSIAKRLAMANAKKAEAELPYVAISKLADATSKSAYAMGMPIQSLVKTMINSPQWANMTEAQRQGAISTVYDAAAKQGGLSPVFQTLLNRELGKLQGQQSMPSLLSSINGALGGGQPDISQQYDSMPSMGQDAQQNLAPTPSIPSASRFPVVPQERSEQPQSFVNEANYKGGIAEREAEARDVGAQSAKQMEKAQSVSTSAQNMDQLIDSASSKYQQAWFKGPGLGKLAKLGPDAAQALKDTNAMAVQMADQLFGAGSSDAKQAAASSLKLNMEDPVRAFDEFSTKMKAQNDRLKWMGTFYQTAKQLGITNPAERDQLWFDYNAKNPPYDYAKHKVMFKNLGLDQNGMAKFITQDRAGSQLLNKKIESTLKDQNRNEEEKFVGKKTKNLYAQTPDEWHNGKQAEASKRVNGKRMLKIGGQWYEEE